MFWMSSTLQGIIIHTKGVYDYSYIKILQWAPKFAAAIARIGAEATAVLDSVKVSAIQALQKVFPPEPGEATVRHQGNGEVSSSEFAVESKEYGGQREPDNSANIISISEEDRPGDLPEQDMTTYRIKDASVKIMVAGVVVGFLTLDGMKFLPSRNRSIVSHMDKGSAMASDVINAGSSIDESLEAMPGMDVRLAEGLVRKWQNIKSQALGSNHCFEKLSEELKEEAQGPRDLTRLQRRIKEIRVLSNFKT